MFEMWRKALDEKKVVGGVLRDLSKAFDSLHHDLMIAKLHAYVFDKLTLNIIHNYLREPTQQTKVDAEYSSLRTLINDIPQDLILGPLLFDLFMNYIFYFI